MLLFLCVVKHSTMKQIVTITNAETTEGQILINELKNDYYIIALTENGNVQHANEIIVDWTKSLYTIAKVIKSDYLVILGTHFSQIRNIDSLNKNLDAMEWLCKGIVNSRLKKIININYRGGYITSDNLFLQYTGIVEKKLREAKLPVLNIQTQYIINSVSNPTMDDSYFMRRNNKIEIIGNGKQIVYVIGCFDLVKTIKISLQNKIMGSYELFSDVLELETLVKVINNYREISIIKIPSYAAYIKALIDERYNKIHINLMHRPMMMMYNARIIKDFMLQLDSVFTNVSTENLIRITKYQVPIKFKRFTSMYNSKTVTI